MKFYFGEVVSFISDSLGRLGEFAKKTDVTGGLSTWIGNRFKVQATIVGLDGAHELDIQLIDGAPSVRTFGIQAIESLRGFDPQADSWFYIGTENDSGGIGLAGDIITLTIAAGDNPANFPAISIDYTILASDVLGTEDELALTISSFYNTQSPFKDLWRAQRIAGNGVIYISARKPGGQFERPNTNDFNATATGTTVVTRAFDKIIRQNKITGLARDPADPRQGQLGIQGSVTQTEGDVTSRFETVFDILVDGSIVPVNFTELADAVNVKFITSVVISGIGNGIKYGQFLSKGGGALPNGLEVSYKSKDVPLIRPVYKTTEDLDDLHAGSPSDFRNSPQSGGDKYISVLEFSSALEIRPQGEFVVDDFLNIKVQDDFSSGLSSIRVIINGFSREF